MKTLRLQAALAILLLAPLKSWAVPSLSTSLPGLSTNRSVDELSVSVGEESFLDRTRPPAGNADYTRLSAHLRTRSDSRPIGGILEVGGSFDTSVEKETSLEVPEAYLVWSPGEALDAPPPSEDEMHKRTRVFAGRKREAWSDLDSYWTLGIWQPLNRFDALRPSEQGLTGAFGNFEWEHAQIILFGSPIFIPEQGPSYELQDGQFSSSNAWFTEPADHVVLVSKGTPVRYKIEAPPLGSVIHHASGGILLRAGDLFSETGFRVQGAFAKKPRNQLSLPFRGVLVTDASHPEANVTIYPQVAYHNVASLEFSGRTKVMSASLSGLADISDPENISVGETWQTFKPLYLISPSFQFRAGQTAYYTPWIRVSTLHTIGGEAEINGGSVKPEQNPFSPRLMYRQAASLELRGRINQSIKGWRIEHGLRWIEEFAEKGTVVMGDLRFANNDNWQVGVWADLLASRLPEDQNPGFISRFRDNDRVGAQLTYVF